MMRSIQIDLASGGRFAAWEVEEDVGPIGYGEGATEAEALANLARQLWPGETVAHWTPGREVEAKMHMYAKKMYAKADVDGEYVDVSDVIDRVWSVALRGWPAMLVDEAPTT